LLKPQISNAALICQLSSVDRFLSSAEMLLQQQYAKLVDKQLLAAQPFEEGRNRQPPTHPMSNKVRKVPTTYLGVIKRIFGPLSYLQLSPSGLKLERSACPCQLPSFE